jgi:uncharacterized membrane protein
MTVLGWVAVIGAVWFLAEFVVVLFFNGAANRRGRHS